ncbi:hypothetical protein FB45DRAFT_88735 [Roridomyces roridus]|uniref:Uncharacterized protein n=1 Tax=Roridomyces roridus TaxID=1738132 RepID=A0AAD7BLW6_9AGAR|nr:hypothetical protein FB45DRAFT_88735 [Roridomyces roridus]
MFPDEIISEILSPALKVPDELFCHTVGPSPFSSYSLSTSAYLLVCKDWLRVATPLLYNVVILRSKPQATALEAALKFNPELGLFVKKLRLEGGFAGSMHTILKLAPNITDLFLTLSIWSPDSTTGLCKGLPLIDPRRVIVVDPCYPKPPTNLQASTLRGALLACIQSWKNLRIFGFPYGSDQNSAIMSWAAEMSQVLAQTQVHTVILGQSFFLIPPFIRVLCTIPSLKVLHFERPFHKEDRPRILASIDADHQLKKLGTYFQDEDNFNASTEPDITPSLNPQFIPMESASQEIRDIIWRRVLFFVMYVEELRSSTFPRGPTASHPSRLPILCVSKYFYRLGLPYLWETVQLSFLNAPAIAAQLEQRPQLGSFICRVITAVTQPVPQQARFGPKLLDATMSICRHAHNLQVFAPIVHHSAQYITLEAFKLLSETAGSSIQELSVALGGMTVSAALFEPFTALRVLEIHGGMELSLAQMDTRSGALETVHTLRVHGDDTLLELFAKMRLDSLCTVGLPQFLHLPDQTSLTDFIVEHGGKLRHLTMYMDRCKLSLPVISFCRNLVDFEVLDTHPAAWDLLDFTPVNPHRSLTKIITQHAPLDVKRVNFFHPTMFPSLREMQVRELKWPTSEREISKSVHVKLAEALLEMNIKLTDSEGKAWVPRLGSSRKRSRGSVAGWRVR